MQILIAISRLLRVFVHLLHGLWIANTRFDRLGKLEKEAQVQQWASGLLERLGMRLSVRGARLANGPLLLISNHSSWADIVVMHALRHCRFISKSDVKHWPVIGKLSNAAGTLYIERESRRDAMRVVHHMVEALRQGDILAVFPEGTTSDGSRLLTFHANLLQAAISADVAIQPVAIRFVDAKTGKQTFAPCYLGDDTLVGSLWSTVQSADTLVEITIGEPEMAQGRDRRAWAADLHARVASMLGF